MVSKLVAKTAQKYGSGAGHGVSCALSIHGLGSQPWVSIPRRSASGATSAFGHKPLYQQVNILIRTEISSGG
jgi:hypothetical protein